MRHRRHKTEATRQHGRIRHPLAALALLMLLLAALPREGEARVRAHFVRARGESPALSLELADTLPKQARGLMYRRALAKRQGMLFVFDEATPRSFWMKDTFLPLDMVFADASCRIVHIVEQAEPHSTASRGSPLPSQFVVEVAGGTARALGAEEGGTLRFVAQCHDGREVRCPPALPPPPPPGDADAADARRGPAPELRPAAR